MAYQNNLHTGPQASKGSKQGCKVFTRHRRRNYWVLKLALMTTMPLAPVDQWCSRAASCLHAEGAHVKRRKRMRRHRRRRPTAAVALGRRRPRRGRREGVGRVAGREGAVAAAGVERRDVCRRGRRRVPPPRERAGEEERLEERPGRHHGLHQPPLLRQPPRERHFQLRVVGVRRVLVHDDRSRSSRGRGRASSPSCRQDACCSVEARSRSHRRLGLVVQEEQERVALAPELVPLGGGGRHERREPRGLGLHAPELGLVRGARRVQLGQRADQRPPQLRRRRQVQLLLSAVGLMLAERSAGLLLLVVAPRVGERGATCCWGRLQQRVAAMVFHILTSRDAFGGGVCVSCLGLDSRERRRKLWQIALWGDDN
jgi:hypothetical protein